MGPGGEQNDRHSPEPWKQEGRYIRDAAGEIVVRGKNSGDARRIVAAINATREIPTEALERWVPQDVSDAASRTDLEFEIEMQPSPSALEVRPARSVAAPGTPSETLLPQISSGPSFLFERRVLQRRIVNRRSDRRKGDRRRAVGPPSAENLS